MTEKPPAVFISYSHDSADHSRHVLNFADSLREKGVDAELDQYHVRPDKGWPHWCEEQLREGKSDFVLVICTKGFRQRVEDKVSADEGRGVYWEGSILYSYIYDVKANKRFIPILLTGASVDDIPVPLRISTRYRLEKFDLGDEGFLNLYRELTCQPAVAKPPLGKKVDLASGDRDSEKKPLTPLPKLEAKSAFNNPPIQPFGENHLRSIALVFPNPRPVGRRSEIARVVAAALIGKPCLITGGPGIGKTTVALAAAFDEQIKQGFGDRQVFVGLDNRSDPLDLLVLLAAELGLDAKPSHLETLAVIRNACKSTPVFAVFDNAEGLIEANASETKRNLEQLRDTQGLSFVVTSREAVMGVQGWEQIHNLPPLTLEESRDLFCRIATSITPADAGLAPLLQALEGHALSIDILASRVDSDLNLQEMLRRWNREKAGLLCRPGSREDRQNSVLASLRLSLSSRHMTAFAKRLLSIIGFLPEGLPRGGLKDFLGQEDRQITSEKSDAAHEALKRLRLVMPREDGAIRLLNPLREAVVMERPLRDPDLSRVLKVGLKLLEKADSLGTEAWPASKAELAFHSRNFGSILREAARLLHPQKLLPSLSRARNLGLENPSFDATIFLSLALHYRERDDKIYQKAQAISLGAYGHLVERQYKLDEAQKYFSEARDIFARIGDRLGEANAVRGLGALALLRNKFDEAQKQLSEARDMFVRMGRRLGEAHAIHGLGRLGLLQSKLDEAQKNFSEARDIYVLIGDRLGEANTIESLGHLALQRDNLDEAQKNNSEALDIFVRIGHRLGEANAIHGLGRVCLRQDKLDEARKNFSEARDIFVRIGEPIGEANVEFGLAEIAIKENSSNVAHLLSEVLTFYEKLQDDWGVVHSGLRLAQIRAREGDTSMLAPACERLLVFETRYPDMHAAPGWRAFCASLIAADAENRETLRGDARRLWTEVGCLGLVRDYVDSET